MLVGANRAPDIESSLLVSVLAAIAYAVLFLLPKYVAGRLTAWLKITELLGAKAKLVARVLATSVLLLWYACLFLVLALRLEAVFRLPWDLGRAMASAGESLLNTLNDTLSWLNSPALPPPPWWFVLLLMIAGVVHAVRSWRRHTEARATKEGKR